MRKLKNKPIDKNQSRITQFFKSNSSGTSSQSTSTSTATTPATTPTRPEPAPRRPKWVDDGDYSEVEVLKPPTPPPIVVVDLLNSSEELDVDTDDASKIKVEKETPVKTNPEEISIEVTPPEPQSTLLEDDNSSGDEILSQIDVDEIIRSSQSSLNSIGLEPDSASLQFASPDKENVLKLSQPETQFFSPRKPSSLSVKSRLSKFSPVRHLQKKRSSQEAFQNNSSSPTPSPSKGSPTRRKLSFGSQSGGTASGQARYFLRNFLSILTEVVMDPFNAALLSDDDHRLVQNFVSLSLDAQHLYVRLFQRKWMWRPQNKLKNNNKELPDDLSEVCRQLLDVRFIEQLSGDNCDLETALDTLDLPKISSLAKKMKVVVTKKTKDSYREALLATQKGQRTLSGSLGPSVALMKQTLQELGPCYRVSQSSKSTLSRLFILHAPPQYWEVEQDNASNQLLILLLNQMGQMEYPKYELNKKTSIYKSQEDLVRFHEAFQLHSEIVGWGEQKDWEKVVQVAEDIRNRLEVVPEKEFDETLPEYLRIYTAGSVLTHGLWLGVEGYQKTKRWKDANEIIRLLLKDNVYLRKYRGRWWERLVINSETHLKMKKDLVMQLVEEALGDPEIKEGHRLALTQRWDKLKQGMEKKNGRKKKPAPKVKPKPRPTRGRGKTKYIDDSEEDSETISTPEDAETQVVELEPVEEENTLQILRLKHQWPTRSITGEKLDKGPGATGKSVFITRQDVSGSTQMASVEQFVIDYYLTDLGYSMGIHGEGSTVVTIYGLLFWDIIFAPGFPDSFRNNYQPFPLDLHWPDFYTRRKDAINEKLDLIRNTLTMDDLLSVAETVWNDHQKQLSIVSWTLFEDNFQHLKSLMRAMGQRTIAELCERLAIDYRYYHSGFPDLVVWKDNKATENKVLFVEVKGPGDHLSEKQQLWLDYLLEKQIPAEVCLVKAVSNKRIRV